MIVITLIVDCGLLVFCGCLFVGYVWEFACFVSFALLALGLGLWLPLLWVCGGLGW